MHYKFWKCHVFVSVPSSGMVTFVRKIGGMDQSAPQLLPLCGPRTLVVLVALPVAAWSSKSEDLFAGTTDGLAVPAAVGVLKTKSMGAVVTSGSVLVSIWRWKQTTSEKRSAKRERVRRIIGPFAIKRNWKLARKPPSGETFGGKLGSSSRILRFPSPVAWRATNYLRKDRVTDLLCLCCSARRGWGIQHTFGWVSVPPSPEKPWLLEQNMRSSILHFRPDSSLKTNTLFQTLRGAAI